MKINLPFLNSYSELPSVFFKEQLPEKVKEPKLIFWNEQLAKDLKISFSESNNINSNDKDIKNELSEIFSGNKVVKNSKPIAMAYSGHQFGHFVPSLGDGRALLLGELKNTDDLLYDIQLKGSGRTPFSRSGDGRSPLGPVIRECIVSEAMHYLGVPTSRALASVTSGEQVFRQQTLDGGVFTRVALSHVRVGTFEYFASRNDAESIKTLLNYLTKRVFLEITNSKDLALDYFNLIIEKQAFLVAKWMSLGFVHGVMNTDNTSAVGITIDYGPCAFLDETDFSKVFSSIDRNSRYAFDKQSGIAKWNLASLAQCLLLSYPEDQREDAVKNFEESLNSFDVKFEQYWTELYLKKIGFSIKNLNAVNTKKYKELLGKFLSYIVKHQLDYTLSFRYLYELLDEDSSKFIFYPKDELLKSFLSDWKDFILAEHSTIEKSVAFLKSINPILIPRNHIIEKIIHQAYAGDFLMFDELMEAIKSPFEMKKDINPEFYQSPKANEKIANTFCGT